MGVPRLHLITNDAVLRDAGFVDRADAVLAALGPAAALHLRGHGLDGGVLFHLADRLRPSASAAGAMLVVNDRVDVALAAGIRAVQLGRHAMPVQEVRRLLGEAARIGYSAHGAEEARAAVDAGADFVVIGTIYPTASHPGDPGAGPERVARTAEMVRVPIIAIGGITPARVAEVVEAGAHGVAVLGGVWHAADAAAAARNYLEALEEVST